MSYDNLSSVSQNVLKGSLSFLVETISNVLVMEIGWTDVGRGGYILVSCAHSNTSFQIALDIGLEGRYQSRADDKGNMKKAMY
jgi:hypothetical protein